MDDQKPDTVERYEGPSNATIALGRAKIYGWIGNAIGAVIGAVIAGFTTRTPNQYTIKATEVLKKIGLNVEGRSAIMAGGAFAGYFIGHYAGMIYGFRDGMQDAGKGRDQFERVRSERDEARAKLDFCIENHVEKQPSSDIAETPGATISARGAESLAAIQVDGKKTHAETYLANQQGDSAGLRISGI